MAINFLTTANIARRKLATRKLATIDRGVRMALNPSQC